LPDRAALCQILRDGVTGFVRSSLDDLVAAVQKIPDISRRKCRDEFERRFRAEVMAANYERVYFPYDLERCTATLIWERPIRRESFSRE